METSLTSQLPRSLLLESKVRYSIAGVLIHPETIACYKSTPGMFSILPRSFSV